MDSKELESIYDRFFRHFARVMFVIGTMLLACLALAGCIAFPTKMPARMRGSGGLRLQKTDVDSAFIKIGSTRRDEIASRLAGIDVGSPDQFFWGRWAESSWGVVAGSLPVSDLDNPAAGSARHWRLRNILVKFDNQGIAVEKSLVDDDETLWHKLLAYSRDPATVPMSEALRVPSADKKYRELILSPETLQFRAVKPKNDTTVNLQHPVVIHLRPHWMPRAITNPELTCYGLEVKDSSAGLVRKFNFCVSGSQVIKILTYFDRVPAPAHWEGK